MATIQESVAEKISGSSEVIKETVITSLAQIEINRRIELITKGINKQDTLEKELKKIDRDDTVTYVQGQKVTAMSQSRFDEITKVKENLEKVTKALNTALVSNTPDSYNKLAELVK